MNPFSKDFKSGIDLRAQDKDNRRGKSLTKYVESRRKNNPTYGTQYGIGELVVECKPLGDIKENT